MPPLSPVQFVIALLRSILFAVLFYGLTVPILLAAVIGGLTGPAGVAPVATLWSRMHRLLTRYVLGQHVVIEGDMPADARFIVCKHESMFETIDALCLLHRPVIAAKRELRRIPVWGWVADRYGLIIVDRNGGASALRAIRAEAQAAFAQGRPLVLFPEGTRVPHGESPPVKAGFAGLYSMLACPVVPVAVDTGLVSPRNSFIKRSGRITYRIGEIIPPGLPRAEAEARLHRAINALNHQDEI